jgi:hypothetical protein
MRRLQREQDFQDALSAEEDLVSAHLEDFPPVTRWEAPPPEPIDRLALLKEHTRAELRGISLLKRSERKEAKRRAREQAETAAQEEERMRAEARLERQRELDVAWEALMSNHAETVLYMLEAAFSDNEAPAAAVDCADDRVTILMLAGDPDLIPERKPSYTPSGNPTLKKRTKSERNELYMSMVASNVLATVKEAISVAPAIRRVVMIVLRRQRSAGLGADRVSAIYCGTFTRDLLEGVDWAAIDLPRVLDEVPDALIKRGGRTAELQALDLSAEPDLESLVVHVERGLAGG